MQYLSPHCITNCVPCGVRKQPPRWSQESAALAASRPRREAQAVRARVTLNLLLAAVVSRQQLIERDRQIADADAGGVIDGVGDGRGGADDADLANALHAYGVDVGVVLVDPGHVDLPTSALVAMWYSAKSWLT